MYKKTILLFYKFTNTTNFIITDKNKIHTCRQLLNRNGTVIIYFSLLNYSAMCVKYGVVSNIFVVELDVCALHEHKHTLIQAIIKFQKCKYIL